jgi:hypothetical protein
MRPSTKTSWGDSPSSMRQRSSHCVFSIECCQLKVKTLTGSKTVVPSTLRQRPIMSAKTYDDGARRAGTG